jgi:hypothetical protein
MHVDTLQNTSELGFLLFFNSKVVICIRLF